MQTCSGFLAHPGVPWGGGTGVSGAGARHRHSSPSIVLSGFSVYTSLKAPKKNNKYRSNTWFLMPTGQPIGPWVFICTDQWSAMTTISTMVHRSASPKYGFQGSTAPMSLASLGGPVAVREPGTTTPIRHCSFRFFVYTILKAPWGTSDGAGARHHHSGTGIVLFKFAYGRS